jgi:MATE family multidrug resistance protein
VSVPRQESLNRTIARLAIPALGALAADPLVSLVDTAFVGRVGTVELAALGVDAAVFGLLFALFNFLAYGTTPLVAAALGRGDERSAMRIGKAATRQALVLGVGAALVVEVAAVGILKLMQAGRRYLNRRSAISGSGPWRCPRC